MAVYVHIGEGGKALSFYDTEMGSPPPFDELGEALVEISPETRDIWIQDPHHVLVNGELIQLEILPEPDPVTITYKADIWRRATDAEAEIMDQMLNAQPIRMRRMWTDAVHLMSNDELFATIQAALTAAFGEARAAELLAPSGG